MLKNNLTLSITKSFYFCIMQLNNYYLRVWQNETVQIWASDRPIKTEKDLKNAICSIFTLVRFTDNPAYLMSTFPLYELHEISRACWLTICNQRNLLVTDGNLSTQCHSPF